LKNSLKNQEKFRKRFFETQYIKFFEENIDKYLRTFIGFNKCLSRVDRYIFRGLLLKTIYYKNAGTTEFY